MKKYDWSYERVSKAAAQANCWFNCLDILGIPKIGGNYRTLKSKISEYGIDVRHFNYNYAHLYNGRHYLRQVKNRVNDEVFANGARIKTENLKKEYIRRFMNGCPYCEECGITEWNGRPIMFQIHHIDGNHRNHSKSNLKLLCPNCHSQTETYANKKRSDA